MSASPAGAAATMPPPSPASHGRIALRRCCCRRRGSGHGGCLPLPNNSRTGADADGEPHAFYSHYKLGIDESVVSCAGGGRGLGWPSAAAARILTCKHSASNAPHSNSRISVVMQVEFITEYPAGKWQ